MGPGCKLPRVSQTTLTKDPFLDLVGDGSGQQGLGGAGGGGLP
jgi:hypothetical protein